jgi:hypothetical protein
MNDLGRWLADQHKLHPPKSPLGKAIGYAINNWKELSVFLKNADVPPDNNQTYAAGGISVTMPRPGLCRVEADPTLGARSAVFTDAA